MFNRVSLWLEALLEHGNGLDLEEADLWIMAVSSTFSRWRVTITPRSSGVNI